ncbi:hypothetical protein DLAC_05069 [Tieghemostelium lacteum]|uniref:Uncharacterized protein n=1 Tax=Tieghemostelium lacteum TaxID=361077 RepID=A0A151ZI70_TIELA|nr:hypothetical protein DLAC_05069 [Tieghemostelium lacteum]|eukprot:KYQ93682.1 hypothetical protein DLAC_05069 [Tieghemostelium lacteum]
MTSVKQPPFNPCYCDGTATAFVWKDGCNESGCRAFAAIFFIGFFFTTVEAGRRLYILRHQRKTATFISLAFLFVGSLLTWIRFCMILAKVREIRSHGVFLLYSYGAILASYMWILIVWCDIIVKVNFSTTIQKYIPILRWTIIVGTVCWFIGLTIGNIIYWPWLATNVWLVIYIFIEGCLFGVLGYLIYREYKNVSSISAHGKLPEETYKKVRKIIRLSIFAIISSMLVALFIWAGTFWRPSSNKQIVAWLFIQRGTGFIWVVSLLVCLSANDRADGDSASGSSHKWSSKMKDLAFSKGSDMEYVVEDEETKGADQQVKSSTQTIDVSAQQGASNP